jgi:phosphoglycolate phosphatase-like HAD superfamily hydrolase
MTGDVHAGPLLVLWDVDHTLIENGGVSKATYAGAFELLTGRPAEHRAQTGGRTDPVILDSLLEQHDVRVTPEHSARFAEVLEAALVARRDQLRARGYALPGARKVLEALARYQGVVQSVLTGNIRPNAYTKVATFDLHKHLDFEVGGYGSDDIVRANLVGVACKRASAKYRVPFDETTTVLVGDTPRDVRAGHESGAYVVAVASGSDSMDDLRSEGADVVLPDLVDTQAVISAILGARARA